MDSAATRHGAAVATFVLGLCFYFAEGREWEGDSHEPEDLRVEPLAKQGESEHAQNGFGLSVRRIALAGVLRGALDELRGVHAAHRRG